ncbi:stage II sporulation protein M [Leptolyngbya sp. FACHB-36]|uniref:stage II sporulation protein M n=1 Tax=Leptolyngbya sp. FACHB-36 TaxID=2692808 RepID=UPI0016810E22|nr:stage II sporulation protein M [Leptolyngbya sp. FACHB-36]MBD2022723.1 stage II sporulation protein M [Leptolyngbya sp. FACHB-36]
MNIKRWIARREPNWKQLDALLSRLEKRGLKALQTDEIKQLASLYRSVSADLARARTNQVGNTLVQDLQQLTSRAYSQIYQGSRRQEWRSVLEFYRWGFPAVVQQTWMYTAIATALFLAGALISWWFAWRDPVFLSLVLPESMISLVRDKRELWMGSILGTEPLASSQIMINNLSVAFRAIAGGMTLGLFTVFVLLANGVLIGTVATLVGQNDLAYPFWAFVFPHGSLELPAIFLAGGAGLLIARGILFPGSYRRVDAVKFYSLQAAQLVFGIIPMLVIAGIIEGFFSPSPIVPSPLKYAAGIGLFALLLSYCRRQRPLITQ